MKHRFVNFYIEGVVILLLFTVFAASIVIVVYLGGNGYQSIVERNNITYEKHLASSYIAAKIRGNDIGGAVVVGGFADVEQKDGIDTLHIYQDIDGERYDTRIYYYNGAIREIFTFEGNQIAPESGNSIVEAQGMDLFKYGEMIIILITDTRGDIERITVGLRSGKEVT